MKRIVLAGVVLVVSLLVAWAGRGHAVEAVRTHLTDKPTDADRKVLKQLQETKVSFEFNEQPLLEVVDFLMTLCTTNIVPERTKFVDPETKITFKMTNASLETVFDRLAEQEGFAWLIRDGVVFISDEDGIKKAAAAAARVPLTDKPTDADLAVLKRLQETIVSFSLKEHPLPATMAFDFLSTLGNVNIVPDRKKFGEPEPNVALKLNNAPLETAIKLLVEQIGLTFVIRGGVVFISDEKGIREAPVAAVDTEGEAIVKALGEKKVSFDFQEQTMGDAVAFLGTLSGANLAADPRAKVGDEPARDAKVTLKLKDVSVWQAVRELAAATGLNVIVSEQLVLLTDLKELKPLPDPGVPAEMVKTFDETAVSFAFNDQPLRGAMDFLRKVAPVQFGRVIIGENTRDRPVTLKVRNMKFRYALDWTARFAEVSWAIRDNLLVISDAKEPK